MLKRRESGRLFQDSARMFFPLQSDEINPMPGDTAARGYLADKRGFLNFSIHSLRLRFAFICLPAGRVLLNPSASEADRRREVGIQLNTWACTHSNVERNDYGISTKINKSNKAKKKKRVGNDSFFCFFYLSNVGVLVLMLIRLIVWLFHVSQLPGAAGGHDRWSKWPTPTGEQWKTC